MIGVGVAVGATCAMERANTIAVEELLTVTQAELPMSLSAIPFSTKELKA